MVKKNTKSKKQGRSAKKFVAQKKSQMSQRAMPKFGPVAAISTAPVAIGNSLSGVKSRVVQTGPDSVRIVGRDFAYSAASTGNATGWCLVGGFPLTPAAFVSSTLRSYTQIYNRFKVHAIACHYITSSATTSTGDVLFQTNKNRTDPVANNTATTFLAYALSDPNTIIGPQWTNHTATFRPKQTWNTLDLGLNSDIDFSCAGEMMLYSKTASTDSPGYCLVDYDISFCELSINPRSGLLPNPNIIYQPITLMPGAIAFTAGTLIYFTTGLFWTGGTTIPNFINNNVRSGDVFKVTLDITNSVSATLPYTVAAGTIPTAATLLTENLGVGTTTALTITDGYTVYATYNGVSFILYANAASAFTLTTPLYAGVGFTNIATPTATTGVRVFGMASWIGNVNANNYQQQ
jgi:hypothetical protein